jgi:lipid A oxidase
MTIRHGALSVLALAAAMAAGTSASRAEVAISVYSGYQGALSSRVSGNDPAGVGAFNFDQRWEGRSFSQNPIYWGARGTLWLDGFDLPNWGIELDYTHAKVYADPLPAGWKTLEFTDGLNIFTANAMYRFQDPDRAWTPYVGVGAGISMPHVEVQTTATSPKTFRYEVAGPAIQAQAGIDYALTDWASIFVEYKFNYTWNDTDLDGGGSLKTNIATNAVDVGLTFKWK